MRQGRRAKAPSDRASWVGPALTVLERIARADVSQPKGSPQAPMRTPLARSIDEGAASGAANPDERRVVVIGTGPAGAAAAWTLHRAGIAVTVLEAGGERSAHGMTLRAPGVTLFRKRRELPPAEQGSAGPGPAAQWFSELSSGGLSNHWTCAVPRFAPEDFTEGARLGEQYRWPVGYDDLASDYPEMEKLLHIGGSGEDTINLPRGEVSDRVILADDWRGIVAQAARLGHGVTTTPLAYGAAWTYTRSGTPFNSFTRVLGGIPRSPRFEVLFGARALRLEWCAKRRRVDRVIYKDAVSGVERSVAASAFVIAAGALHSTRLLLESTSPDFPEGLGNQHGVVGRYLHDHPLAKVRFSLSAHRSIHPPAYFTRAPYEAWDPLRGAAGVLWSSTLMRVRSLLGLTPDKSSDFGFTIFGSLPPLPSNGVALDTSRRDADGVAALKIDLNFDEQTVPWLLRARDRIAEVLDADGLDPALEHWKIEVPGSSVHLAGTARMHAEPKWGVLDGFNRVHGVPEVLVVDAASFTTGPEKNPTLTAMALAARASRRLAADLRA